MKYMVASNEINKDEFERRFALATTFKGVDTSVNYEILYQTRIETEGFLKKISTKTDNDTDVRTLTIPGANVKMDILEDRINLHLSDGEDYFTLIPQTNGIDSVDRIIFAKNIADKFRSYATHTENDENGKVVIRFTAIDSSDLNNIEFDCDIIRVEESSQENITDAETGEV